MNNNMENIKYNENNKILVISISGKARHGKDTVCDIISNICDELKIPYKRLILAGAIKEYAKMLGWDGLEETKPRQLLQELGTEIIRNKLNRPLYHSERLCNDIDVLSGYIQVFIIPDVRFHNELEYIKARFPYDNITIRVEREGFISPLTIEQQNHKSETDLDDYIGWDVILKNNGTIEELSNEIKNKEKIYKSIKGLLDNE